MLMKSEFTTHILSQENCSLTFFNLPRPATATAATTTTTATA